MVSSGYTVTREIFHCVHFTLYMHGAIALAKVNSPDGRLSPREWELSGPIVGVAPEVAVDDKWAVPQGLSAYLQLLRALYRHQHRNLTSVRPVRPTTVMGQAEWPTQ